MSNDNIKVDVPNLNCRASVDRIRFYNPENHYAIIVANLIEDLSLKKNETIEDSKICFNPKDSRFIIVTGTVFDPQPGDEFTFRGHLIKHDRFGYQYKLSYADRKREDTKSEDGKYMFLSRIFTELQVANMYAVLDDPFTVLEESDLESLLKVHGVQIPTAQKWFNRFNYHYSLYGLYAELPEYNFTISAIEALMEKYKNPELVVNLIKENPYQLVLDRIPNMGFKRVDKIALDAGMDPEDFRRVKGFIHFYLDSVGEEGDSYITVEELMGGIEEYLGSINRFALQEALRDLEKDKLMWSDKDHKYVGSMRLYDIEDKVARHLLRIRDGENHFKYDGWKERVRALEQRDGIEFTDEQWQGIQMALENQIILITGPSGSGKSTLISGLLAALSENYSYKICALAGRAAARLSEVTGQEGYTIHRLLGFSPKKGWAHNENFPLDDDIIINDEIGMSGLDIVYHLVQSIKTGAKFIMVGDERQLAPIGAGNVAHDVLHSPHIPTIRLTKIHRQAAKSAIITESLKISSGIQILKKDFSGKEIRGELQDLRIDAYLGKDQTMYRCVEHAQLAANQGVHPDDIQVILPVKSKGEASVYNVNIILQEFFNPMKKGMINIDVSYDKTKVYNLRIGDRVINRRNNYDAQMWKGYNKEHFEGWTYLTEVLPVYNGNIGHVKHIFPEKKLMVIDFDGIGMVAIQGNGLNDIQLAYAITCHSAQGSEMNYVIVGVDFSGYSLLSRQWVYTAITRAKKMCILCCETPALRYAIGNNEIVIKKTHLYNRLEAIANPKEEF